MNTNVQTSMKALAKALDITPEEARRFIARPGVDLVNIAAWAEAIGPKELIKKLRTAYSDGKGLPKRERKPESAARPNAIKLFEAGLLTEEETQTAARLREDYALAEEETNMFAAYGSEETADNHAFAPSGTLLGRSGRRLELVRTAIETAWPTDGASRWEMLRKFLTGTSVAELARRQQENGLQPSSEKAIRSRMAEAVKLIHPAYDADWKNEPGNEHHRSDDESGHHDIRLTNPEFDYLGHTASNSRFLFEQTGGAVGSLGDWDD